MTGDRDTADDRGTGLLTFAAPLMGQRERFLGTHGRRGLVLLAVLAAIGLSVFSMQSDEPGAAMLLSLVRWNTWLLLLVAASAGAEAFSAEHARQGRAFLQLAETRPLRLGVNLVAAQLLDVLLLIAAQAPLMLLALTLGGVTAGQVAGVLLLLAGWSLLTAAVGGWMASTGLGTVVAVIVTGVLTGLLELPLLLLSAATGVEFAAYPVAYETAPAVPVWGGLLNAAWQTAAAVLLLRLAGWEVLRPKSEGTDLIPVSAPTPTGHLRAAPRPGADGRPRPPASSRSAARALARPRAGLCPHRWKGSQFHVGGGDGIAVRVVIALLLWMAVSLMSGSPLIGLTQTGTLLLFFELALASARRVRLELEGDVELIRLLPSGERHAAVETRRGAWPALLTPASMWVIGYAGLVLEEVGAGGLFTTQGLGLQAVLGGVLSTWLWAVVSARISGMLATQFATGRSVVGGLVIGYVLRTLVSGVVFGVMSTVIGFGSLMGWYWFASLAVAAATLLVLRWVGPRDRFLHALVHGRLGRLTDLLPTPQRAAP